jgi:hypothetical protein
MVQFKNFRILLVAVGVTCCTLSFAQFTGGGKVGVNFSNLRGSSVQNNSMLIGYNIGGFVNVGGEDILSGDIADILSVQVELVLETKGAKMDYPTIASANDTLVPNVPAEPSNLNLTYVTIPLLAKFNFGDKKGINYYAEGGFYGAGLFGVTVDGEKKYDEDFDPTSDKRNYRDDFDGFDLGIVFGGGASIPFGGRKSPWRAFADLRYSLGLSSIGEKRPNTPESFTDYVSDIKTSAISLSFGVAYKL